MCVKGINFCLSDFEKKKYVTWNKKYIFFVYSHIKCGTQTFHNNIHFLSLTKQNLLKVHLVSSLGIELSIIHMTFLGRWSLPSCHDNVCVSFSFLYVHYITVALLWPLGFFFFFCIFMNFMLGKLFLLNLGFGHSKSTLKAYCSNLVHFHSCTHKVAD